MSLRLRLDNVDTLPDGGPVSYEVHRRGLDIGRDSYLDWTLPDAERFISGKHCEIRYRDGGYWLHDVSTNGTTLNGRGGRLTEPYRLQDGDRIHIGQYIVAVELTGEEAHGAAPEAEPLESSGGRDPWGGVDNAAATIDRRDFAAHARAESAEGPRGPTDLSEENISWGVGRLTEGAPPTDDDVWGASPSGGAGAAAADEWGWTPPSANGGNAALVDEASADARAPEAGSGSRAAHSGEPPQGSAAPAPSGPAARAAPPVEDPSAIEPAPLSGAPAPLGDPFSGPAAAAEPESALSALAPEPALSASAPEAGPAAAPSGLASRWVEGDGAPQPAPAPASSPAPASAREPSAQAGAFVAAFERGAGMPAGSVVERGDEAFAEELGALFKLVTRNLQAMLAARAETKSAMRSSERTMIGALENNPLKFSPSPEDALRIMFGAKSRSYLDATKTVEESFRDLQKHQVQTFAAMQQALQALIEDLDPQGIEDATAKDGGLAGIVGSRRAKFWDTYVERFRAKSGRHERGMIDAFMVLFSEMYDRQR